MTFIQKHPRTVKELRPLLLPWIVAVFAGSLIALKPLFEGGGLGDLLPGIASYGFFGGLALIAVLSFGTELHERTLPLLLTQPFSRSRLWNQKMLTLTAAILTAAFLEAALLTVIAGWYPGNEVLDAVRAALGNDERFLAGAFLLATVCSAGFWTLVAGSTLGGLVFTVSSQFGLALVLALGLARLRGDAEPLWSPQTFFALGPAGLVYSAVFLWLGRRKFVGLQVKSARFGEGVPTSGAFDWQMPWSRFLVSQPTGGVPNLVRKELRLQKPLFQLAAVFVLCWLATLLLQWLRPSQNLTYLFDVLTCLYAPASSLLAGSVSFGEEKALGLAAAQLTLPLSPRRQWFVKLGTCLGTATILSLGLPLGLFWATGALIDFGASGLMNPNDNGMLALVCIEAIAFLLGYWAISLTSNTVRAALVAVVGLVLLGAFIGLGTWSGMRSSGLEIGLLTSIMCHFQLPPDALQQQAGKVARTLGYAAAGAIILIMFGQSLVQFRRTEEHERKLFAYSLTLAGLIFALSFWAADITSSIGQMQYSRPIQELRIALSFLVSREHKPSEQIRLVPTSELAGRVSEGTTLWLRNAAISYNSVPARNFKDADTIYQVCVSFPNGRSFYFLCGHSTDPLRRRYGL
jgi:ABC-type transport system involved in multi-copper enzyme maturation permease subunit